MELLTQREDVWKANSTLSTVAQEGDSGFTEQQSGTDNTWVSTQSLVSQVIEERQRMLTTYLQAVLDNKILSR